jgi:hypothetical protein
VSIGWPQARPLQERACRPHWLVHMRLTQHLWWVFRGERLKVENRDAGCDLLLGWSILAK